MSRNDQIISIIIKHLEITELENLYNTDGPTYICSNGEAIKLLESLKLEHMTKLLAACDSIIELGGLTRINSQISDAIIHLETEVKGIRHAKDQ